MVYSNLVPCSEDDLKDLEELYKGFFSRGNTELKAAYLAVTERGFTDIFKSNRTNTQMVREKDLKYVIFQYDLRPKQYFSEGSTGNHSVTRFHTDLSVF